MEEGKGGFPGYHGAADNRWPVHGDPLGGGPREKYGGKGKERDGGRRDEGRGRGRRRRGGERWGAGDGEEETGRGRRGGGDAETLVTAGAPEKRAFSTLPAPGLVWRPARFTLRPCLGSGCSSLWLWLVQPVSTFARLWLLEPHVPSLSAHQKHDGPRSPSHEGPRSPSPCRCPPNRPCLAAPNRPRILAASRKTFGPGAHSWRSVARSCLYEPPRGGSRSCRSSFGHIVGSARCPGGQCQCG